MSRISRGLVAVFLVVVLSSGRVWDHAAFNVVALRTARALLAGLAMPGAQGGRLSGAALDETLAALAEPRLDSAGDVTLRALVTYLGAPTGTAVAAIETLVSAAGPVRPVVSLWLGSAYANQGLYDKAQSLWAGIGAAQQLKALGDMLAGEGRWQEAAAAYTASLKGLREDVTVYFGLGRALEQLGQQDAALKVYEEALAVAPSNYGPYVLIGDIYRGRRMFDEAQAWYDRAVRKTGATEWPYIKSAQVYEMQGKLDQARSRLEWVVAHYPGNCQAWGSLGLVLLNQGLNERALEALREGNELCPGVPWLVEALGRAREASGHPEGAPTNGAAPDGGS